MPDANRDARTNDAGPELVEVLQESHPAFRRVIIWRLNVESIRLWAHAPDSSTRRGVFCKKGIRMGGGASGLPLRLRPDPLTRERYRSFAAGSRAGKLLSARTLPLPRRLRGFLVDGYPRNWASGCPGGVDHAWMKAPRTSRCEQLPASLCVGTLTGGSRSTPLARLRTETGGGASGSCRGDL